MRRLLLIALILGVATIALALFAMFSVGSRVSPRNAPIVASSPATPAASAGGSPAMQPLERCPAVDGAATVKPDVEFALQFSLTENMPASPRNAA